MNFEFDNATGQSILQIVLKGRQGGRIACRKTTVHDGATAKTTGGQGLWRGREEMDIATGEFTRQVAQRRNIIDDKNPTAVRADDQIMGVGMDLDVPHQGHPGDAVLHAEP